METRYRTPFDTFERWCPVGEPAELARYIAAYVDAGCTDVTLSLPAEGPTESIDAAVRVRELVRGGRHVCETDLMSDVWPMVHAERAALIDELAGLADDQWDRPSLCGEWTVHDVAAHLVNNAKVTRLRIVRRWFGRGSTSTARMHRESSMSGVRRRA